LERGGYRVTRLGVEEVFDEVKYLGREQYLALGLPDGIRTLPDLLVTDPGVTWARLIEVKFRRRFDRRTAGELIDELTEQRRFWPESSAVILLGQPFFPDARFHQDFMRVVPPGESQILFEASRVNPAADESALMQLLWERLPMLTSMFHFRDFEHFGHEGKERGLDFWSSADFITAAIRELGRV
jgi:hypothetical protein